MRGKQRRYSNKSRLPHPVPLLDVGSVAGEQPHHAGPVSLDRDVQRVVVRHWVCRGETHNHFTGNGLLLIQGI